MPRPPRTDRVTDRVERFFRDKYVPGHPSATVRAYRYNGWSIRIRVIDPDFEEMSLVARDEAFIPILREFDERVQERITILLALTPEESTRSRMSAEFDAVGTPAAR